MKDCGCDYGYVSPSCAVALDRRPYNYYCSIHRRRRDEVSFDHNRVVDDWNIAVVLSEEEIANTDGDRKITKMMIYHRLSPHLDIDGHVGSSYV